MKMLIKIEELMLAALALWLFAQLEYSLWWALLMLLAPDISMLGYLLDTASGADAYNLLHHKGIAVGLYLAGAILSLPILQATGLVIFGHSSLDRVFGYGLKHSDAFQHTHLGWSGGAKPAHSE
ncbi:MAG: DUF4260 family protein [Anaerolineales bacterium]|nr:DUF4260 family protein [Anaerolineales bacterium]